MRRLEPTTAESHLAVLCGIAGVSLSLTAPEIALPVVAGAITGWYWRGRERRSAPRAWALVDAVQHIEVARDGRLPSLLALSARADLVLPGRGAADPLPRIANGVAVLHRSAPGRAQLGVWILDPAIAVSGEAVDVCFVLAGPSSGSPEALLLQEQIGRLVASRSVLSGLRAARTATDATCALLRGRAL